jgi:hypothetical protein
MTILHDRSCLEVPTCLIHATIINEVLNPCLIIIEHRQLLCLRKFNIHHTPTKPHPWDEHMEAAVAEWRTQLGAALFALGGVYCFFLVHEAFPHQLYNVIN